MKEEWKQIKGYEDLYEISNFGRVWTCRSKRMMKPGVDNYGYRYVHLCDGKSKSYKVHRLVALHFIPLVEGKEIVNHIDEVKGNNHVSNLEWCTQKENCNHGTARQRLSEKLKNNKQSKENIRRKMKPVIAVNIKTGEEKRFESMTEAGRNGFNRAAISKCINGHWKHHKKYKWYLAHNRKVMEGLRNGKD